jgi:cobaltochelatase CobS
LVNIVQAYSIFEDRVEAINYCINRFDDDTKTAFMDLWTKMNAPVSEVPTPAPTLDDEVPF